MNKNKSNDSIHFPRHRSNAYVWVAILIISMSSLLIIGFNMYRIEHELNRKLTNALKLAETMLPKAIWQMNYDYLNHFLDALFLDDAFVYAEIRSNGKIVVMKKHPQYAKPSLSHVTKDSRFIFGKYNIVYEEKSIGSVNIFLSRDNLYKELTLNTLLAVALVGFMVLCFLSYYRKLQESEWKFRSLYENTLEGIFQIFPDGKILQANPSCYRILGLQSLQSEISALTHVTDRICPDPSHQEALLQMLRENGEVSEFEMRLVREDSRVIWVVITVSPVRDVSGKIIRYDGYVIEVTERREKENALQEIEVERAASQAKTEFLANISHEIRTPMNAIIGLTGLVIKTELTPTQRDYLMKVQSSAKLLLHVINDILDFSKIETGQIKIDHVNFHLEDIITRISDSFMPQAEAKKIDLTTHIEKNIPLNLIGDPIRLRQILMNLVSNALKFTDFGKIAIRCKLIEMKEHRIKLQFSVQDTGIGIRPDYIPKLFNSFTQADGSSTRKYGGAGLGLAISKHLVELMKGEIWVESKVGTGSSFHFTAEFGIQNNTPSELPSAESVPQDVSAFPIVLVVEDNPINQQVAKEILDMANIRVVIARNGKEALQILEAFPFDAVLMDLQMPIMDGYEATRRIRNNPRYKKLPIIAMTAHAMTEDRDKCLNVGMNEYITKPIEPEKLFSVLSAWIKSHVIKIQKSDSQESKDVNPFPVPSLPGIDVETALHRIGGNVNLFHKLLLDFKKYYHDAAEQIRNALNNNNKETAQRMCHTIKGIAGNISMTNMYNAAQELEQKIKHDDVMAINASLENFEQTLAIVLESIKSLDTPKSPSVHPEYLAEMPLDSSEIAPLITELSNLIQKNNPKAEQFLENLKPKLGILQTSKEIKICEESLGQFDFKKAHIALMEFMNHMGIDSA